MSKYDKMLELNKRKSEEKVERAVLTIRTMVLEREKVSVPALMQKTGLSRGFFYKNPIVRGEIDAAMEQQSFWKNGSETAKSRKRFDVRTKCSSNAGKYKRDTFLSYPENGRTGNVSLLQ